MDIIDIVLSKKYTDESLKGITGTLAGKNCTIKSATKVDGVTTVVFAWTADDGTEKTTTIQVNDGVGIANIEFDANSHLIVTLTDGSTIDAGLIQGGGGTDDYEDLINRPKIEGIDLIGNKTFEDLGIASATDLAQTDELLQDLADLVGNKTNLPMPNETVVDNIEYVDTKIDGLMGDITELKEDNVTISSKLEKNEKRVERAEATAQYAIKMQQGYTYEYQTVVGSGSEIDVPVGSKDYAGLHKIGGMSRKGYQLLQDNFPESSSQLSVTKNGSYNYTLTTLSVGPYRQCGTQINVSGLAGEYTLHAEIVGTGGLIFRFFSEDQTKIAEFTITSNTSKNTIHVPKDFAKSAIVFLGNQVTEVPIGSVTTISNIMLENGNTVHSWEPYTADLIEAPVDSVVSKKKSGEVIRTTTLPPEMLALCPDYGQGTTESYNYIDFETKSYHHAGSMTQNGVWTPLDTTEIIDLSAAWSDDLEILTVTSGGTVQMHYPKLDDDFKVAVPSEIVFLIDIAKVIKE